MRTRAQTGRSRAWLLPLLLLPGTTQAASYGWCVDNDQNETVFDCSEFSGCDNPTPFATIGEALAAAAATGDGDYHHVCVRSNAPHTESFVVDDSSGALGGRIRLEFRMIDATSYCPGGGTGPAISVLGGPANTELEIMTMWSDFAGCSGDEASAASLLEVDGASVEMANARLANLDGGFAALQSGSNPADVLLLRSRLERFDGVLASGVGRFTSDDSEVSGFVTTGAPLLGGGWTDIPVL